MLVPLMNSYQHLSFLRLTFLLVVLLLAVNTVSLPFGAAATSLAEKERYGRTREEERLGFVEGHLRLLTGLQKRGLGRGNNGRIRSRSIGVKKQTRSEPFQEVSGNHPTGHSASRGTVAVVVGLITLIIAGFMV